MTEMGLKGGGLLATHAQSVGRVRRREESDVGLVGGRVSSAWDWSCLEAGGTDARIPLTPRLAAPFSPFTW